MLEHPGVVVSPSYSTLLVQDLQIAVSAAHCYCTSSCIFEVLALCLRIEMVEGKHCMYVAAGSTSLVHWQHG